MRAPAVLAPVAVTAPPVAGAVLVRRRRRIRRVSRRWRRSSGSRGVDAEAVPDARAIGELAQPRFAAGEGVPAADALPLYVRHRVALTTAERAAGARL